ncbi:MAG: MarR family transcriptional regulator [Methanobacteriaceae archaeon]
MNEELEKELIDGISIVEMSSYREKVLVDLKEKIKTPSRIAKSTKIGTSHVSTALKELKEHNLVVCLNPEKNQGRIYKITKLGEEVLKYI